MLTLLNTFRGKAWFPNGLCGGFRIERSGLESLRCFVGRDAEHCPVGTGKLNIGQGVTLRWVSTTSMQGEVEVLPMATCYRNRDILRRLLVITSQEKVTNNQIKTK